MIGMSRPMQRRRGSDPSYGRRVAVRRDPVVDDLEVLLVEALGLGEVLGETLRDGDVDVRERADRAVGEAEPAPLSELVEAVLRREPKRHARDRAGELAVRRRRGRGACAGSGGERVRGRPSPRRTRSDRRPPAAGCRRAARRARGARRANSHAPGSSSWSMRKRTSQPRSRRSGSSCSRWASEPEMPATFCVCSTTPSITRAPPPRGCHAPTTAPSDPPRPAREAGGRAPLARRC